jgi:DHA2 family lincomycin resistance protein-like MFS transporter
VPVGARRTRRPTSRAAVGTTLSVTVLTARSATLAAGAAPADALLGGFHRAFSVAAGLALVTLALAVTLPGRPRKPLGPSSTPEIGPGDPARR